MTTRAAAVGNIINSFFAQRAGLDVDSIIATAFLEFADAKARLAAVEHEIHKFASMLENTAKALRANPSSAVFQELGDVRTTANSEPIRVLVEEHKKVHTAISALHATLSQAGKGHLLK
jgi:hypothetical protein